MSLDFNNLSEDQRFALYGAFAAGVNALYNGHNESVPVSENDDFMIEHMPDAIDGVKFAIGNPDNNDLAAFVIGMDEFREGLLDFISEAEGVSVHDSEGWNTAIDQALEQMWQELSSRDAPALVASNAPLPAPTA